MGVYIFRGRRLNFILSAFAALALVPQNVQGEVIPPPSRLPRNIILIIGDGMGPQQVGLALAFAKRSASPERAASFEHFVKSAHVGIHLPFPAGSIVNDSACSATMISSGCSCKPGQLGIDENGAPGVSVIDAAKKIGKRVGLISDTRITHATPAAFAVHVSHRSQESEVAEKLISNASVDLLFSGGINLFLPKNYAGREYESLKPTSERQDQRNLIDEARSLGFKTAFNQAQLTLLTGPRALGLFASSSMQNAFDEGLSDQPTLATMTKKGLELLNNDNGFFLMVEAGQIDWAGHQNDAGWMLRELLRLSSTILEIQRFVEGRDDTLVILTADHETGGFGFSYRPEITAKSGKVAPLALAPNLDFISDSTLDILNKQRRPVSEIFKEFLSLPIIDRSSLKLGDLVARDTELSLTEKELKEVLQCSGHVSNKRSECIAEDFSTEKDGAATIRLARAFATKLGIVWATPNHTSTPVLVFSQGPGAEKFARVLSTPELGVSLKGLIDSTQSVD